MIHILLTELNALREAHRRATKRADFYDLWNKVQWIEALSALSLRNDAEERAMAALKLAVSEALRADLENRSQPTDFPQKVLAMEEAVKHRPHNKQG